MHQIAVAGHVCLDIAPVLPATAELAPGDLIEVGPISITLGGSVANTGGTLADLGAPVTPFATVGADELGETLVAKLRDAGLLAPRLAVSPTRATSYSLVLEKPGIDRTFWHHTGANDEFDGTGVQVDGFGLLHVGYPSLLPGVLTGGGRPLHSLLARAREARVTTSLDLAVVDRTSAAGALDWRAILGSVLAETDIVSPSLDDLTSALRLDAAYSLALVDELADWMLARGAAVVAISAGQHGLRLRTASAARLREGGTVLAPLADGWADAAVTVTATAVADAVTTNGAGDASTAGLLFALAAGGTPEQGAALAVACSAAIIGGRRATPDHIAAIDPSLARLLGV